MKIDSNFCFYVIQDSRKINYSCCKIGMALKYFRYHVKSIFQQMHIVPLQVTQIKYVWSNEWSNQVMYSNIEASVLNENFV